MYFMLLIKRSLKRQQLINFLSAKIVCELLKEFVTKLKCMTLDMHCARFSCRQSAIIYVGRLLKAWLHPHVFRGYSSGDLRYTWNVWVRTLYCQGGYSIGLLTFHKVKDISVILSSHDCCAITSGKFWQLASSYKFTKKEKRDVNLKSK